MGLKEISHGSVHLREKISTYRKRKLPNLNVGKYSAHESHRKVFKDKNLWSLVESYSRREMSFEADIIHTFGGILRSAEAKHGRAIWGIPQYHFLRGLSWYHVSHHVSLRREGFPSWSWVGWRTQGSQLSFANCKRKNIDTGVFDCSYSFSGGEQAGRSVWDLPWFHHTIDEHSNQMQLTTVQLGARSSNEQSQQSEDASRAATSTLPKMPDFIASILTQYNSLHEWGIPGHPGDVEPPHESMLAPVSGLEMPPLSHILRFFSSVATILVHPDMVVDGAEEKYRLLVPGTKTEVATVNLGSLWSGIGKTHGLVYISRWCSGHLAYTSWLNSVPESLHLLLIESVPGWGEVKRRVQLVQEVSLLD